MFWIWKRCHHPSSKGRPRSTSCSTNPWAPSRSSWHCPSTSSSPQQRGRSAPAAAVPNRHRKSPEPLPPEHRMSGMRTPRSTLGAAVASAVLILAALSVLAAPAPAHAETCGPVVVVPLGRCDPSPPPTAKPSSTPKPAPSAPPAPPAPPVQPPPAPTAPAAPSTAPKPPKSAAPTTSAPRPGGSTTSHDSGRPTPPPATAAATPSSVPAAAQQPPPPAARAPEDGDAGISAGGALLAVGGLLLSAWALLALRRRGEPAV